MLIGGLTPPIHWRMEERRCQLAGNMFSLKTGEVFECNEGFSKDNMRGLNACLPSRTNARDYMSRTLRWNQSACVPNTAEITPFQVRRAAA